MDNAIDKIAWVHIVDRKVLCARSKGKDTYYMPGGKRDPGETDEETLQREVAEELSVSIIPETISYFGTFEAEAHGKHGKRVKMACYSAEYRGELQPASEIEELAWLTYEDRNRVSDVTGLIFDSLHESGQI
ncbi:NUDIX hydrolase [Gorillibacterium massiliense]|uniref:NUDIX hydrolase n=1 Tax=Gorillibacterium massiliense TaxID=1280390 RepID=UPI0004AD114B|nr:NUDIX domain-containing protein [Gorillibacterium massiliense]